jgi:hypothetical protein
MGNTGNTGNTGTTADECYVGGSNPNLLDLDSCNNGQGVCYRGECVDTGGVGTGNNAGATIDCPAGSECCDDRDCPINQRCFGETGSINSRRVCRNVSPTNTASGGVNSGSNTGATIDCPAGSECCDDRDCPINQQCLEETSSINSRLVCKNISPTSGSAPRSVSTITTGYGKYGGMVSPNYQVNEVCANVPDSVVEECKTNNDCLPGFMCGNAIRKICGGTVCKKIQ